MKHVICFYWQGDRWQEKENTYEPEDPKFKRHARRVGPNTRALVERYVNNLYLGVKKHAVEDFKFVCFTNDSLNVLEDIELRPFRRVTDRGVLPRMFMFSREAGLFGSQVLCLDLDVVITGSLSDIMGYEGHFCARERFAPGQEHLPDGDIMSFHACKEHEELFWDPLVYATKEVEEFTKGRERLWVEEVMGKRADLFCNVAPGQVRSYKMHVKHNGLKNARIVSCHGFPRPHQIKNESWLNENWK